LAAGEARSRSSGTRSPATKPKKKKKRSGAEAATAGKRLRHCTGWRMLDPKILLRQEEELQAGTRQAESWSEVHK